jgi:hypothetical protein
VSDSRPPSSGFEELIAVLEATRSLAGAADLDEAMSLLARQLTELFEATACVISRYDAAAALVIDWAAFVRPPAVLNTVVEQYGLDEYPATRRVVEDLCEIATTIGGAGDAAEQELLREMGYGALLMAPLVVAGRAAGLIEIYDTRARTFTPNELRYCRLLADQAGTVLATVQLVAQLEEQHLATVAALAAALAAKDASTGGRARTIGDLAEAVGEELGIAGRELSTLRMAALMHDVGKIGIPDAILRKPSALSAQEFELVKRHTVIGAGIIAGIPGMGEVERIVRSSHERWDGTGYPDRLRGTDVPLASCVIAVCDAYQAMTEGRSYRRAVSSGEALAEVRRCSGSQFMPAAAEALIAVCERDLRRRVRFSDAA